jgi:hypothetical protein
MLLGLLTFATLEFTSLKVNSLEYIMFPSPALPIPVLSAETEAFFDHLVS